MYGITAQVSLYPLGKEDLGPAIHAAIGEIGRHGIEYKTGEMSTVLWGDDEKVFPALLGAFREAASRGQAVMTITVSNACPWPGGGGKR
ncbi:MAG: YkoF family thiamine/hydroxymethylpyrimidine-binding protein [Thermodesulfobacteriota bacterium]